MLPDEMGNQPKTKPVCCCPRLKPQSCYLLPNDLSVEIIKCFRQEPTIIQRQEREPNVNCVSMHELAYTTHTHTCSRKVIWIWCTLSMLMMFRIILPLKTLQPHLMAKSSLFNGQIPSRMDSLTNLKPKPQTDAKPFASSHHSISKWHTMLTLKQSHYGCHYKTYYIYADRKIV